MVLPNSRGSQSSKNYMKQKFYYTKHTQNSDSAENLNLRLYSENKRENVRAGRLAWLGHWLYEPKVAGSSPVRPTTRIFSAGR